jgi:hypothetical protein
VHLGERKRIYSFRSLEASRRLDHAVKLRYSSPGVGLSRNIGGGNEPITRARASAEKDILLSQFRGEPETEQISSTLGLALARALVMGSFYFTSAKDSDDWSHRGQMPAALPPCRLLDHAVKLR